MELNDTMKRRFASRHLKDATTDRWSSITTDVRKNDLSWTQFKDEFEIKFVPKAGNTLLCKSFFHLKRGGRTVAEYENQLIALSRFRLGLVYTPLKKNEMFIAGMRPEFRRVMTNHLWGLLWVWWICVWDLKVWHQTSCLCTNRD